jgi:16S rRNA (uracil1498-N3)-methyltransferase
MRFLFCDRAGETALSLPSEQFLHLKARRARVGEIVALRNLREDNIYAYLIESFGRFEARLTLANSESKPVLPRRDTRLAWCVVDPKAIEKSLPFLNETGVGKLSLLWSEKSQRGFRPNLDRFDRIIAGSCEQCGRSRKMAIEIAELDEFLRGASDAAILDFGGAPITSEAARTKTFVVGPEGGFGAKDYAAFGSLPRFSVDTPLVLRSETAISLIASLQSTLL